VRSHGKQKEDGSTLVENVAVGDENTREKNEEEKTHRIGDLLPSVGIFRRVLGSVLGHLRSDSKDE